MKSPRLDGRINVFWLRRRRQSTDRWDDLENGRLVSCGRVDTAWTRSSVGLAACQPVQTSQSRCHVVVWAYIEQVEQQHVVYLLQRCFCQRWKPCEDRVTIIQSRQHQHTNKFCGDIVPELSTQTSELVQVVETWPGLQLSHVLCLSIRTPRLRTTVTGSITLWSTLLTALPVIVLRRFAVGLEPNNSPSWCC